MHSYPWICQEPCIALHLWRVITGVLKGFQKGLGHKEKHILILGTFRQLLGGVLVGSPTSTGHSFCHSVILSFCNSVVTKKRKLAGWVFYPPNLYWGQAGATSGVQTAEHVYTECTVLFSLALTRYPTYFARLQFFLIRIQNPKKVSSRPGKNWDFRILGSDDIFSKLANWETFRAITCIFFLIWPS